MKIILLLLVSITCYCQSEQYYSAKQSPPKESVYLIRFDTTCHVGVNYKWYTKNECDIVPIVCKDTMQIVQWLWEEKIRLEEIIINQKKAIQSAVDFTNRVPDRIKNEEKKLYIEYFKALRPWGYTVKDNNGNPVNFK